MVQVIDAKDTELPTLLGIAELADYLGVPVSTVYLWRSRNQGPPGFRVGRQIRFRTSDVLQWLEERRAEAGAG
jgi:excisionase family DNA binding protein